MERKHGNLEAQRYGGAEAPGHNVTKVQKQETMKVRRNGESDTGKY